MTLNFENNNTQQTLRDVALAVWKLTPGTYNTDLTIQRPSQKNSGTYWRYDKRHFLSTQVAFRNPGEINNTAKYFADTAAYSIDQSGLRIPIFPEEHANTDDVLDPQRDATKFLMNNFIVDYEIRFMDAFVVTDDVWALQAQGQTAELSPLNIVIDGDPTLNIGDSGAGAFRYFDIQPLTVDAQDVGAEPLEVFKKAMNYTHKRTGVRPNRMIIPRQVLDAVGQNDNVRSWASQIQMINGSRSQTVAIIATHIDIEPENIHISDMVYQHINQINLANRDVQNAQFGKSSIVDEGGSVDFEDGLRFSNPNNVVLLYKGEMMGPYSKTSIMCWKWTGFINEIASRFGSGAVGALPSGEGNDVGNLMIRAYKNEENLTEFIDGNLAYDLALVAPELGFYLKECVTPSLLV